MSIGFCYTVITTREEDNLYDLYPGGIGEVPPSGIPGQVEISTPVGKEKEYLSAPEVKKVIAQLKRRGKEVITHITAGKIILTVVAIIGGIATEEAIRRRRKKSPRRKAK